MIESYSFGKYIIDGKEHEYDIKIINNQVKKWRNHNMSKEDIIDLVEAKPELIIIGTGAYGVIKVSEDIKEYIKSKDIHLIIEKTGRACEEYNKAEKKGIKVAAIFHGTC